MTTSTTCTMAAPWMLDVHGVGAVEIRSPGPWIARAAKDGDDSWPVWYVAGPDGQRNVCCFGHGRVFCSREAAEAIVAAAMKD